MTAGIAMLAKQCSPVGSGRKVVLIDRQSGSHVVLADMAFVPDLSANGRFVVVHKQQPPLPLRP